MLVALGGGVVGDICGFAAATLLRGIDFVQIPTTLLAQVDSSVGGKTAINTAAGKNLLGAFYQPRLVLADSGALATLPRRELLAGYAEMVKYGLIADAGFFDWLDAEGGKVCDLEPAALNRAVITSCRMKAEIVAGDERETGDARALLNFGHTFGHALEAETGFGDALLHGEAVALGMVLAFDFAVRQGICTGQDATRVRRHIAAMGLPTELGRVRPRRQARRAARPHGQGQEGARRPHHADPAAADRRRLCDARCELRRFAGVSRGRGLISRRPVSSRRGLPRRSAIEIDDIDADRRGEARHVAVALDLGDELVERHPAAARDVPQPLPHRRFQPHARPTARRRRYCG